MTNCRYNSCQLAKGVDFLPQKYISGRFRLIFQRLIRKQKENTCDKAHFLIAKDLDFNNVMKEIICNLPLAS
jgi:hypothetical protein